MKKKLFYAISALLLFLFCACTNNSDSRGGEQEQLSYSQLSVQTLSERETYQTEEIQDSISEELKELHEKKEYTLSEPLAVWNPYGTVANSLYLSFELENDQELQYTISTDGYEDFSQTAKKTDQGYLLIGFISGEQNSLTLTIVDSKDTVVKQQGFLVTSPDDELAALQLEETPGSVNEELADGLFALTGAGDGHTFLFDNNGTLRTDILTSDYRADRLIETDNGLLFANSSSQIVRMNGLGKFEDFFTLSGYNLHHDFTLVNESTLLILATKEGSDTVEDIILTLDLETGEFSELVDMSTLLSEYVERANTENTENWDWLHINSIQPISEEELILSSRETSAIIKLSNINEEPTLDYIIGESDVWEDTSYSSELLTQVGDFPNSGGQHSVNYLADDGLSEGQYYLYFYNNNMWRHNSNPNYSGSIPEGTGTLDEGEKSMFYQYLVDETQGTYELIESFDLPYSSIVSNVQTADDHYVINSGYNVHLIEEYTLEGELIRSFDYSKLLEETEKSLGYRVFKLTFNDFWFVQ